MKLMILILSVVFCPFAFAIRGSDITGAASVVLLLFIFGFLIIHILLLIFALVILSKKWNKTNELLEEMSKRSYTD